MHTKHVTIKIPKFLSVLLIIPLSMSLILIGCGESDSVIEEKVEDIYGLDFDSPEYVRMPIDDFSERIATWFPTSREAAERLDANDLEGALEILYRDIMETDPYKEDQFFFSAIGSDWETIFMDPKLVFDLYRDRDRSRWSEDEMAAADLIVALTYELGGYAGAVHEDVGEGYNTDKVRYELGLLAEEEYAEIAERYPNSRLAILAKLALAKRYINHEDGINKIFGIQQEIEQTYPDSIYISYSQLMLAAAYDTLAYGYKTEPDKAAIEYRKALSEYEKVLEFPDFLVSVSLPEYTSAHAVAEYSIEEIKKIIGE